MALQASIVLDRAERILFDETNVRWSQAELIDYLNAGISAILINKPDANVVTETITLVPLRSRQVIPNTGLQLIKVVRVIDGPAIRQIDVNHLDHADLNWHNVTGTPQYYVFDVRDPKQFWIYPSAATTTDVQIVYSKIPDRIVAPTDDIPLDDVYEVPLTFFVVGMAYLKNTTRGDAAKGTGYISLFDNAIGTRTRNQSNYSPAPPDESPKG